MQLTLIWLTADIKAGRETEQERGIAGCLWEKRRGVIFHLEMDVPASSVIREMDNSLTSVQTTIKRDLVLPWGRKGEAVCPLNGLLQSQKPCSNSLILRRGLDSVTACHHRQTTLRAPFLFASLKLTSVFLPLSHSPYFLSISPIASNVSLPPYLPLSSSLPPSQLLSASLSLLSLWVH